MSWRRATVGLVLVIALAGCGPNQFGVGMQKILSDILFGQPKPAATPAPPPAPETPLPPVTFLPPLPVAAPDPCPSAPLGAPAVAKADVNVDAPPQNGVYRWLSTYQYVPAGSRYAPVRSGFENRLVEQSTALPDYPAIPTRGQANHHFTFTTVQPDPIVRGYTEIISYNVQTYSPLDYTNGDTGTVQNNIDPNAGIDIVDIKRIDQSGKLVEEFNPGQNGGGNGVLVFALPLPAGNNGNSGAPTPDAPSSSAYSWEFTIADPANQWTMRIAASEPNKPAHVDACGQVVDGWPIDANVQITKRDPATGVPYPGPLNQTWHYVVAPEFGGLIVQMSIDGDAGNGATIHTNEQLASVVWPPLPKGTGT